MEENIAILMADLSGYTALTETHGATAAADLVDRFVEIVENCLVGSCELKERTGDEVMIISASADLLLSTATMIYTNALKEENFLQVHAGLHYGKVLKRNNRYFGSAINLAARIAAKASPGTFWCSMDFINALKENTSFRLEPKGKQRFKNIHEEKEVAQILLSTADPYVIDPVCRMLILDTTNAIQHPVKTGVYFCSQSCLERFSTMEATLSHQ